MGIYLSVPSIRVFLSKIRGYYFFMIMVVVVLDPLTSVNIKNGFAIVENLNFKGEKRNLRILEKILFKLFFFYILKSTFRYNYTITPLYLTNTFHKYKLFYIFYQKKRF